MVRFSKDWYPTRPTCPYLLILDRSQKAYWLQHLKRVRRSTKDLDIQYRRLLNEDGCSVRPALHDRLQEVDDVITTIHNLESDSLEGLRASLSTSSTQRSQVPHIDTAISDAVFFTRLPGDPGSFEPDDHNILRKLIHERQAAGQLECAIQLQECLLLSYRQSRTSSFSAESRAELKLYQDIHKLLFEGFNHHVTKNISLPEDHLPFLEHSEELIGMAINCRIFFESTDIFGRSLLHVALSTMQVDFEQIIKRSPMIHHHDRWGLAPIHLACMNGNAAAVYWLLVQGASILVPVGVDGWLPWHFAAFSGNTLVVEQILGAMPSANIDINCQTAGKQTALGIAARYGRTEVIRLLLDRGADPRVVDKHGRDALHRAVLWRSHDAAKLLIKRHGAKLAMPEKETGYNPLHVLCYEDVEDVEWQPSAEDDEKMMHLLLTTSSLDPNSGDENGETALHLAVSEGPKKKALVKFLVSCPRVSLNVRDKDGKTPMFVAVEEGYSDLVKILLDTGRIQFDIKDKYGATVLSIAQEKGFAEIMWLIEVYAGAQKVSQSSPRKK